MKYKKGIFIVWHSKLKWPTFWGKLEHILKVILNKSFTLEAYINPEDIEKFERK